MTEESIMNKTTKPNWASEHDYEKAFAYIEEKGLDTNSKYQYKALLESAGKDVYMKSLEEWLGEFGRTYTTKGFEL